MSKRSNVGLVIKSVARVETFVEEWNGHNTFAHQQFDALFQLSHFFFISISHFVQRWENVPAITRY